MPNENFCFHTEKFRFLGWVNSWVATKVHYTAYNHPFLNKPVQGTYIIEPAKLSLDGIEIPVKIYDGKEFQDQVIKMDITSNKEDIQINITWQDICTHVATLLIIDASKKFPRVVEKKVQADSSSIENFENRPQKGQTNEDEQQVEEDPMAHNKEPETRESSVSNGNDLLEALKNPNFHFPKEYEDSIGTTSVIGNMTIIRSKPGHEGVIQELIQRVQESATILEKPLSVEKPDESGSQTTPEPWRESKANVRDRDKKIWDLRNDNNTWEDVAEGGECGLTTAKDVYKRLKNRLKLRPKSA